MFKHLKMGDVLAIFFNRLCGKNIPEALNQTPNTVTTMLKELFKSSSMVSAKTGFLTQWKKVG